MYQVEFRAEAVEELHKIDRVVGQRIVNKLKWLSENFDQITPIGLSGSLQGLFKLRIGDYRIIYSANQEKELLTVHLVGHRRDVYR